MILSTWGLVQAGLVVGPGNSKLLYIFKFNFKFKKPNGIIKIIQIGSDIAHFFINAAKLSPQRRIMQSLLRAAALN